MKEKVEIRHCPPTDLAYGYRLREAVNELYVIIDKGNYDLFDILNLFEISLYLNDFEELNDAGKELINSIFKHKSTINTILGRYFNTINDNNFNDVLLEICKSYHLKKTILKCFIKYKVFNRICDETFKYSIENEVISIYDILHFKEIVKKYNVIIKNKMLTNNDIAELFVKKYDYVDKEQVFFPIFSKEEKETIISNYLSLGDLNINYLRALNYHIDSKDTYILTPNQRLEIKKLIEDKGKEIHEKGFTYSCGICIKIDKNEDDVVEPIYKKDEHIYTFPGKWIDDNLDYPTLLNNFIYILDFFDFDMNMRRLANINDEDVFERYVFNRNKTTYTTGFSFKSSETYNHLSFVAYINYLKQIHNIDIEDVIEWFFNEYLLKEFNISNFNISLSTDKKYINRCKVLFPEFDGILKKYRIYTEFKKINDELLEVTKETLKIDDCPSLIKNKYLIINKKNNDINYILHLLFNDQSHISYVNENLNSSIFAKLILEHQVNIHDFEKRDFQLQPVNYLLDKEIIYLEDDIIKIKPDILAICKYLYDNNFIKNHNYVVEKDFVSKGYLLPYSKLFAPDEADYLNYNLNNSKFGDARALSNKYRHVDTTTENEQQIYNDYLIGLRMLILIIIKINDELCESEQ